MQVAKITFTVIPPENATPKQVEEWIKFQLGHGSINTSNPLQNTELNADTILVEHINN